MSIRMDYDLSDETDLSVRATAYIRPKEGRFFKAGGLWIYDNEIDRVEGSFEDGDILTVRDFDGYFLGYGFINRRSAIRIRMLSRHEEEKITNAFLAGRVHAAWEYRKKVIDTSSCRVVFGEADFLPGITIDKYEDILVIESLALGTDRLKGLILEALCTVLAADGIRIRGIYERSDAKVREKEGLPRTCGFLTAPFDTKVKIRENGVQYYVDVENGQKTGFFLDQNAAMAGAAHVLSVDSSALAIEQAKENAALNGLSDRIDYQVADVFALLPELEAQGRQADVVILDPPAFTKSRSSIRAAVRGYREINLRGMRLTRNGGFLVTCSCSHFMDPELFRKTIGEAAHDAHVRLRQVEFRTQAPDHPILWNSEESYYLKFYIFQVVRE